MLLKWKNITCVSRWFLKYRLCIYACLAVCSTIKKHAVTAHTALYCKLTRDSREHSIRVLVKLHCDIYETLKRMSMLIWMTNWRTRLYTMSLCFRALPGKLPSLVSNRKTLSKLDRHELQKHIESSVFLKQVRCTGRLILLGQFSVILYPSSRIAIYR